MSGTERPLWERMREAAETLRAASYEFTGCSPAEDRAMREQKWNAVKLEVWADKWESEASTEAERTALEDQLTRWIFNTSFSQASFDANPFTVDRCRNSAKALLERFDISPRESS